MWLQRPTTSRIYENNSWLMLTLYQRDKCSRPPNKNIRPNSSANNCVINHNHNNNIFTFGTQYSHIFTSVFTLYMKYPSCCINYKWVLICSITQNTLLYYRILRAEWFQPPNMSHQQTITKDHENTQNLYEP
jgi:hypothetical protein